MPQDNEVQDVILQIDEMLSSVVAERDKIYEMMIRLNGMVNDCSRDIERLSVSRYAITTLAGLLDKG